MMFGAIDRDLRVRNHRSVRLDLLRFFISQVSLVLAMGNNSLISMKLTQDRPLKREGMASQVPAWLFSRKMNMTKESSDNLGPSKVAKQKDEEAYALAKENEERAKQGILYTMGAS